jgi:MscS family membrane protein
MGRRKGIVLNPCETVAQRASHSVGRATCLGIGAWFICLSLGLFLPLRAQVRTPLPAPAPAQPEVPKDLLGRSTPRGTVLGFLTAARNGNDEVAAQYLDTRLRGNDAAALAHKLFVVLDRRLPPRLNQVSDMPEGSLSDPLNPDQELVGTVKSDDHNLDIFVERTGRGKSGPLWLFSSKTLASIPEVFDEVNVVPVERILPGFLINTRLASIALFEWLAVLVGMPCLYFLIFLVSRLLGGLTAPLLRRLYKKTDLRTPELLPGPVRLLVLAFIIQWTSSKVSLPLLARQFWSSTATVITIAACVWLLIVFANWGEVHIRRLLGNRNLSGATSMVHLVRWVVDLLIIFGGVFVTLHYFGVNPTAALAGLGVGGIAVAFAAQKTLENIIGGVSLIFDQAVRVGDVLKVGESRGTVMDIGLRSTRIRTPDRTVIIVPNGQIANMTLENFSSRDKFWFHPIPALSYRTTSTQLYAVLERIRRLLQETPHLEPASIRVRLLQLGPSSLDVEIFAYVLASDWNQFLSIQEFLLLRIIDCIESSGVQFAFPLQTNLTAAVNSNDAPESGSLNALTAEKKLNDKAIAAKSG